MGLKFLGFFHFTLWVIFLIFTDVKKLVVAIKTLSNAM